MSATTGISWCDSTFNPWIGCAKVSPACDHCYAERLMDHRLHKATWGAGQPRVRTSAANWKLPRRWDLARFFECSSCGWRGDMDAADIGKPRREPSPFDCPLCHGSLQDARRRVFCASLGDVFDNEVNPSWRDDLFALIKATPSLDWLLLTKRIGNVPMMISIIPGWLPDNVWLGITVVNQQEADRDIPKLLAVPAAKRFLSIEPILGQLVLHPPYLSFMDWIIAGGESGPDARPAHMDWIRSLRDQCAAARVPFHFKQWGEWLWHGAGQGTAHRVGREVAGRMLDGVEHNGFP